MLCPAIFKQAAILGCIAIGMSFGQPTTFDAVSVKAVNLASHPTFGNSGGPGTADPGRVHFCCVGMFSLLMRAYGVEIDRIAGPAWMMENMGPNLYQVDATLPPGTTKAQFQVMMQNLLAERFHLKVHRETRNFPGYDLVVAKDGPKLKAPAQHPNGPLPPGPQLVTSLGRGMVRVQAQEKSIADLLPGMGRLIEQSLGADPTDFSSPKLRVIDKTGLTGKYDFTLEFACEGCQSMGTNLSMARGESTDPPPTDPLNIFVALEKQLGLKLMKTQGIPLDVIIVDHVDKIPTAN